MKQTILAILLSIALPCLATIKQDASEIPALISKYQQFPITIRIAKMSHAFIGKPYVNEPLGEGIRGLFNQEPLYRTDVFDCQTYVSTIVAMAKSDNFKTFSNNIKKIRYRNGAVSFATRNHFPTIDWIANNLRNGMIKDINFKIAGKKTEIAIATIDKKSWYRQLPMSRIKLSKASKATLNKRLKKLNKLGDKYERTKAILNYIPLSSLFSGKRPNMSLFNKIPNGSIIFIVRPNWDLKDKIGTHLNVSHVGFAIWNNGKLYYRHASSVGTKVITQEELTHYLARTLSSPTIRGISVYRVTGNEI